MTDLTAADLVRRYNELDDWLGTQSKRFDEHVKPAKTEMDQIKAKLHEMLLALGSKSKQSISTDFGTAYTTTIMSPKISDKGQTYLNARQEETVGRDAFLDFCLDNWDQIGNQMLQIGAPQKDAVKEYMDTHEGMPPPGVEISNFVKVNIRRS